MKRLLGITAWSQLKDGFHHQYQNLQGTQMYVFLIFVAVHETLWCNHCHHKTSLTAQYFCTVVAAFARCSYPTRKLYFKTSTTGERKQVNRRKTMQIYAKQSEVVLKNNN